MKTVSNNHKVKGAFVWHKDEIKMVTKSDVDIDFDLILERSVRVKRRSVTLVKVGDHVSLKKSLMNVLPERSTFGKQRITHIRENGLVGTNKDAHEFDDTNYKYFQRWT